MASKTYVVMSPDMSPEEKKIIEVQAALDGNTVKYCSGCDAPLIFKSTDFSVVANEHYCGHTCYARAKKGDSDEAFVRAGTRYPITT